MLKYFVMVLALWTTPVTAEVYKWVDDEGVVQYGDQPPSSGAEKVELPPSSVYEPRPLPSAALPDRAKSPELVVPYKKVAILSPAEEETIRDNTGAVDLSVELEPPLQAGHRMAVIVDGRSVDDRLEVNQVTLTGVHRGTHKLQVKVLNADGAEQAASRQVTFHMHRASVLTPSIRPRNR